MTFSVADIPITIPDPPVHLIEYLREYFQSNRPITAAQIDLMTVVVDETVARTLASLELLLEFELRWRESVFRGEAQYNLAIENEIRSAFKNWSEGAGSYLSGLMEIKNLGFFPHSLESLRPRLDEVRSMLTPDGEFFEGEGLDDLTTGALAEDERGETVKFRTMGE